MHSRGFFQVVLWMVTLAPLASSVAALDRELEEIALDLGGQWKIAYDPLNVGLSRNWHTDPPSTATEIRVPSCFEETPAGADYDGVVWYFRPLRIPPDFTSKTLALRFGAVNYACRVWLNGRPIGEHEGGYAPFTLPLAEGAQVNKDNLLALRVVDPGLTPIDGLTLHTIPSGKESWYFNFGGIYGPVRLLGRPALSIENVFVMADPATGKVKARVEIEKRPGAPESALLEARITARRDTGRELGKVEQKPALESGRNQVTLELAVEKPDPWSPENPALYQIAVTLAGQSRKVVDFGFRSFTIENGDFRLNGKPFFARAVLYQPYFPRALAYPPDDAFIEREVSRIKEAGFNLVRCHAGAAPPALLRLADERGLLVLEEPPIGWPESAREPIATRCLAEMADLVRRDRNHASVVAWGTLSAAGAELEPLAREALALDPTRPVFGNWPLAWTEASTAGCRVYLPGRKDPLGLSAGQIFPRAPLPDASRRQLETLGTSASLTFVSAVGSGGITRLFSALDEFGGRGHMADFRLMKRYVDAAREDFQFYRLYSIGPDFNIYCEQAARAQMAVAAEMIESLRANPNVDGFCYSQWRDAAWECGPGLVDTGGNPKRDWEKVHAANRPILVVLRVEPESTTLDQPVLSKATVVNEAGAAGAHEITFILRDTAGRETRQTRRVELRPGTRVIALDPIEWKIEGGSGHCELRAELQNGAKQRIAESVRRFLYVGREQWDLGEQDIVVVDPSSRRRAALAVTGIHLIAPPSIARSRVVLVPATGTLWKDTNRFAVLAEILERIGRDGGTLLLDCSEGIDPALARLGLVDGKLARTGGGFLGKFLFVRPSARIRWLPTGEVMMADYRSVIPNMAVMTDDPGWEPQIVLVDGYGRFNGYAWAESRWGAGRVAIFTLPVFDRLDRDPVARLLVWSLLTHYRDDNRTGERGNLNRDMIMDQFQKVHQPAATADLALTSVASGPPSDPKTKAPTEWMICGPFQRQSMETALRGTFAPEREFRPTQSYRTDSGSFVGWRRHRAPHAGHIDFIQALSGEKRNAAAYALAFFYSERNTKTLLRVGSDDGIRVFLNGRRVLERLASRGASPDQDRDEVVLRQGWNRLLVKIANGDGEWQVYLSLDEPVVWSVEEH